MKFLWELSPGMRLKYRQDPGLTVILKFESQGLLVVFMNTIHSITPQVIHSPTIMNWRSLGEYCQQRARVAVTQPQMTVVSQRGAI